MASKIDWHSFFLFIYFVTAVVASLSTVFQHLQLLAVVKGVRAKDVDDEAARMVTSDISYGCRIMRHQSFDAMLSPPKKANFPEVETRWSQRMPKNIVDGSTLPLQNMVS